MTRLASLSCGALAGLLHTRALADASGAPAGQHGFLAIRVERDQETVLARYPVQAAGSADFAYECAERACEKARVPRSPGVYGVNAYVLEIYAPEDIAEPVNPAAIPDPVQTRVTDLRPGDRVDLQGAPGWTDSMAEFELATCSGVERESAACLRLDFEGLPSLGIDPVAWLPAVAREFFPDAKAWAEEERAQS